MNQQKQQLINFLSEQSGFSLTETKKLLKGVTLEEENSEGLQVYVFNKDSYILYAPVLECAIVKRFNNNYTVGDTLKSDFIVWLNDFTFWGHSFYDHSCCPNLQEFRDITYNIFSGDNLFDFGSCYNTLSKLVDCVGIVDINNNIENYYICSAEELLFDCGANVPEYVRRYVDIQAFIDDLTYDNYIDLGDGDSVLYYGC